MTAAQTSDVGGDRVVPLVHRDLLLRAEDLGVHRLRVQCYRQVELLVNPLDRVEQRLILDL